MSNKRSISSPRAGETIIPNLQTYEGGTGATSLPQAILNLDVLQQSVMDQPNGPASTPAGGLNLADFDSGVSGNLDPTLQGPTSLTKDSTGTYTITNYDMTKSYAIAATNGSVTQDKETLTVVAGSLDQNLILTVNNKTWTIEVTFPRPNTPSIVTPVNASVDRPASLTLTSSAFSSPLTIGGNPDTHKVSDWQLATDAEFANVVSSATADTTNLTTWTVSGLTANTRYYARVRHQGNADTTYSKWSATTYFNTRTVFVPTAEEAKKIASDSATSANFGRGLAINTDGTRIAVGAMASATAPTGQGVVYIFSRSGTTWVQEARVQASTSNASDEFGISVSLNSAGNRLVVGSPKYTGTAGSNQGTVWVYGRTGVTWSFESQILASDLAANALFGTSVGITGDGLRIVVGAPAGSNGAFYSFALSGGVWTQEQKFTLSDGTSSDRLATTLGISADGTRLGVSAYGRSGTYSSQGMVVVLSRAGSVWSEEARLSLTDAASNNESLGQTGVSLDATGTRLLVGTMRTGQAGAAAYVFVRSGVSWSQEAKLVPTEALGTGSRFTNSLSMNADGSVVVVGASGVVGTVSAQGALFTFSRTNATWNPVGKLQHSDPAANDALGRDAVISGNGSRIVGGAFQKNLSTGAVYIYA